MDFESRIEKLNEMIKESGSIVFFGGAGVSTESGIPDFRSKDGLYNQHDVKFDMFTPEYLLSNDCLYQHPTVFYEFYRQKMNVEGIEPNITHNVLAKMEEAGKLTAVVTQNIDGLHQKAGSKNVLEVHGTTLKNYCDRCGKVFPSDYIFKSEDKIPRCECGGMVRPYVTLYGEQLPPEFEQSVGIIEKADMIIVGGTSLTVYPASSLVQYYRGDKLVIINRDETSRDMYADLVFHEALGEVFKRVKY